MQVESITKYVRISPSKVNDIAILIRGKNAEEALAMIKLIPRKGAELLARALSSAIANAENNHNLKKSDLIVKAAEVCGGPIIRRFRPKARGSAGRIRKRTSHFKIILTDEKI